jgi:predicted MFS family arabinose efflux permease
LLWALVAGYAIRLAPPHLAGKAMAVAMAGTPMALSLGIPAGTLLGNVLGWRMAFGGLSLFAVVLAVWMLLRLPDFSGEKATQRPSLVQVLVLPGVRPVLLTTIGFVLAHNILYTYIAPILQKASMLGQTDKVLLTFGLAGLAGIIAAGALIDRYLYLLSGIVIALFAASVIILGTSTSPYAIYAAAALWGLGFGGAPTLLQTACAKAAGAAADAAQAMFVTGWNLAMAGGAVIGGYLLHQRGSDSLPWAALVLLALSAAALRKPPN